jgi:hypothetical protein
VQLFTYSVCTAPKPPTMVPFLSFGTHAIPDQLSDVRIGTWPSRNVGWAMMGCNIGIRTAIVSILMRKQHRNFVHWFVKMLTLMLYKWFHLLKPAMFQFQYSHDSRGIFILRISEQHHYEKALGRLRSLLTSRKSRRPVRIEASSCGIWGYWDWF